MTPSAPAPPNLLPVTGVGGVGGCGVNGAVSASVIAAVSEAPLGLGSVSLPGALGDSPCEGVWIASSLGFMNQAAIYVLTPIGMNMGFHSGPGARESNCRPVWWV